MGVKKEVNHSEEMHRIYDHVKARRPSGQQLNDAYKEETLIELAKMFYIANRADKKLDLANQVSVAART